MAMPLLFDTVLQHKSYSVTHFPRSSQKWNLLSLAAMMVEDFVPVTESEWRGCVDTVLTVIEEEAHINIFIPNSSVCHTCGCWSFDSLAI